MTSQSQSQSQRSVFKLNNEQKKFVTDTMKYIEIKQTGYIIVNAPAGTGKTTCVNVLLDQIKISNSGLKVQVLCPTNKAKSLIKVKKYPIKTIHSFFNLIPIYDSNGDIIFGKDCYKCQNCKNYEVENEEELPMLYEHMNTCTSFPVAETTDSFGVIFVDERK